VANTLLPDNALATMGAGLPSAIVASMLYPERRMLAVCGDGGLMMNSREMETAAPLGFNLVVLILQDNAYGIIRGKQAVDGFANWGLSFGNPNFVKYAEAYGAKRWREKWLAGWRLPSRQPSMRAGCTLWSCRSTSRKTYACWSSSCATACRLRHRRRRMGEEGA
jgi:acetolactate synthase-1/2/3 large subunit